MKIRLNKEQVNYLNGLKDTETKEQFLLDCFIEQCEASLEKETKQIITKDGIFKTTDPEIADFLKNLNRGIVFNFDSPKLEYPDPIDYLKDGTVIQDEYSVTTVKTMSREKFDKFIQDNGLKKFTPVKKETINGIDNYLTTPFINFYNPFIYREEDTEKFLKDVVEASKFFNVRFLKELKNYHPPHPDDVKKYSKKDLEDAFNRSRYKGHFGEYTFDNFEYYIKHTL